MGHLLGKHEWKTRAERSKNVFRFPRQNASNRRAVADRERAGQHCARVVEPHCDGQRQQGVYVQFQFESAAHNIPCTQRHKSLSVESENQSKNGKKREKGREMMREDEVGRASCQLTANAIAQNSITHIGYGYAALWVERTLLLSFLNRLRTERTRFSYKWKRF